MTTINPNYAANGGDIPDAIDTLEALLFWAGSKYNQIHASSTYAELQATSVDTGQRVIGSADVAQTPGGSRAIIRASMPISSDWADAGVPIYESIQEQSQALLP
jgi:hypothetical protein